MKLSNPIGRLAVTVFSAGNELRGHKSGIKFSAVVGRAIQTAALCATPFDVGLGIGGLVVDGRKPPANPFTALPPPNPGFGGVGRG